MMPQKNTQNDEMIDKLIEQQLNNAVIIKKVREANKNDLQLIKAEMTDEMHSEIEKAVKAAKNDMQEFVTEAIEEVRKIIPLSDGEATQLQSAISSRATITTTVWIKQTFGDKNYGGQELFSKKYGHIIRAFYGIVKKQFDAIKYTTILHADIEEALKFANSLNIRSLGKQTLRITDKQLETVNKWETSHGLKLTKPEYQEA